MDQIHYTKDYSDEKDTVDQGTHQLGPDILFIIRGVCPLLGILLEMSF